jgi:hypothetical protein
MKQPGILVIGGCHVAGFPLEPAQSFSTVLNELTSGQVVRQVAYVGLARLPQHLALVDELQPSHVVLQLGNFELSDSFLHLLRQAGLSPARNAAARTAKSKLTACDSAPVTAGLGGRWRQWGRTAGLSLLLLVLWFGGRLHHRSLRSLRACIRCHPQVTFVFVSPLPSLNPTLNTLRRLGGWLLHQQVVAPNCYWLDSHQLLRPTQSLFSDPGHLSAYAHRALAYGLAAALASTIDYLL